jgi:hypothetical protein
MNPSVQCLLIVFAVNTTLRIGCLVLIIAVCGFVLGLFKKLAAALIRAVIPARVASSLSRTRRPRALPLLLLLAVGYAALRQLYPGIVPPMRRLDAVPAAAPAGEPAPKDAHRPRPGRHRRFPVFRPIPDFNPRS